MEKDKRQLEVIAYTILYTKCGDGKGFVGEKPVAFYMKS